MKTRFNEERAGKAVEFFETRLHHTKGRWSGAPFLLDGWQRDDIVRPLFGTEFYSNELDRWIRLFRKAYIELPKKNGKSELASGLAAQGLYADGEPGPEVYSIASTRRQAKIVFDVVADMAEMDVGLKKRSVVNRSNIAQHGVIYIPRTRGIYKVIPGDVATDDGINPSRAVLDELHRQKTRDVYDLIDQSFAARDEPLFVVITTAGVADPGSIAWEVHEYARQVSEGVIDDPHLFTFIRWATVEETDGDGWKDETLWRRVNPALSFNPGLLTDLRQKAVEAEASPAKVFTFKRLRLNVWLPPSATAVNKLIDLAVWDRTAGIVDEARLKDAECDIGLDMASTIDFAAMVGLFENAAGTCPNCRDRTRTCFDLTARFWTPSSNLDPDSKRWPKDLKERVAAWGQAGLVNIADGDVIDDRDIQAELETWAKRYTVAEIGKDPFQSKQLGVILDEIGLPITDVRQTFDGLSVATEELIGLATAGRLHHGGNPVLRWMIDNTVTDIDTQGRKKPSRRRSVGKIDGVAALVDAIATHLGRLAAQTDPLENIW